MRLRRQSLREHSCYALIEARFELHDRTASYIRSGSTRRRGPRGPRAPRVPTQMTPRQDRRNNAPECLRRSPQRRGAGHRQQAFLARTPRHRCSPTCSARRTSGGAQAASGVRLASHTARMPTSRRGRPEPGRYGPAALMEAARRYLQRREVAEAVLAEISAINTELLARRAERCVVCCGGASLARVRLAPPEHRSGCATASDARPEDLELELALLAASSACHRTAVIIRCQPTARPSRRRMASGSFVVRGPKP